VVAAAWSAIGVSAAFGQPATTPTGPNPVEPAAAPAANPPAVNTPTQPEPVAGVAPGTPLYLPPVVVTASRTAERPLETPYSIDVVGSQQIQDRNYRGAPEAIAEIPGVMNQRTGPGQASPFIRGFTGFRTLMMVDGIRLNNSTFRSGPNQYFATVDALSVDRFEVLKGPSSVLYGSDAIGGTINAITKSPSGYGQGTNHSFAVYQRGASAEKSYAVRPEATVTVGQNLGIIGGATYRKFGDLEGGRDVGEQPGTGYDEWSGDAKVEYFLAENQRLVFAHQQFQMNNARRAHSTVDGILWEGTTRGSDLARDFDQYRSLTYVQYHADRIQGPVNAVSASLSWQQQYEREDRQRSNGVTSDQETNVGTLGAFVQLQSKTPIGELTYGIEYYRDNVSSRSSTNPIQGPVADDASYDLLGIYIQDRIAFTDRFEVTLGGRFTYARADANSVTDPSTGDQIAVDDDWTAFVGSVRAAYFIVPEHVNLYGGVSQGFRAPNLSDLSRLDIARTSELQIPSPGLDPEYYISYEIGVKAQYENFAVQLAYFYTDIKDQIIGRPTGATSGSNSIVQFDNGGDGYIQGIELGLSYRFHPDFTFFSAFSWQDGEIDQFPTSAPVKEREPASRLLPTTTMLGVRWDDPSRKFFVEGVVTIAAAQNELTTGDTRDTQRIPPGGTPSYEVFSIRSGWQVNDNARLTFAIENITDEDYRVHGSGINSPGRNFVGGLELRF
jgi:hemoglobin/transferrin/lactoferrin receptor protein